MGFFKQIKQRQQQARELYLKTLRSGYFVLDVGQRGFDSYTHTQVKIQQKQFLTLVAAYRKVLMKMGWVDRFLYGETIRSQVDTLSRLKDQVNAHVKQFNNPINYSEHIDLSLLPEYVEMSSEGFPERKEYTHAFKCG